MKLKEPSQAAAINASFYLHTFLRDFRTKKDHPSFLIDQSRRVKKFDQKHSIPTPAAVPNVIEAVPSAAASNPVTLPRVVVNPSPAAPTHLPVVPVVPSERNIAAAHSNIIFSPNKRRLVPFPRSPRLASPGPGPKTMAIAAATSSFVSAARRGDIRRPRGDSTLESDVDVPRPPKADLDPKGKGKQRDDGGLKERKRKWVDVSDETAPRTKKRKDRPIVIEEDVVPRTKKRKDRVVDVDEESMLHKRTRNDQDTLPRSMKHSVVQRPTMKKDKLKSERKTVKEIVERVLRQKESQMAKTMKPISTSGSEFKESSSEDEDDSRPRQPIRSDVIHSRPRPPISQLPQASKINRSLPIPTGEYYHPPCSTCRTAGTVCERQATGEACVRCRTFKHKCEFAKLRKSKRNTTPVESEDDSSTAAPRKPRVAAKAAKKAIKRSSCKSMIFL